MALNFRKTLERLAAGEHIDKSVPEVVDAIMPQQDTSIQLTPAQGALKAVSESIVPQQGMPNNPAYDAAPQGAGKITDDVMNQPVQPREGGIGNIMSMPEDTSAAPRMLLTPRGQAKADYQDALNAPVKKHSKLGDVGAYIVSGLNAALNPNPNNKVQGLGAFEHDRNIRSAVQKYGQFEDINQNDQQSAMRDAQRQNIFADNDRLAQQEKDRAQNQRDVIQQRREVQEQRVKDTKLRTVASMWSKLPEYDPSDPRFSAITKALGDVDLPLTPKDAKKKVQMLQDAETGAWTVTLTDPVSGQQEVRPVTNKDGSQLATTSSSKVMANAGLQRQTNEHEFNAGQTVIKQNFQKELERLKGDIGIEKATMQMRENATNGFKAAYFKLHGKSPSAAEIKDYLTGAVEPMLQAQGGVEQ